MVTLRQVAEKQLVSQVHNQWSAVVGNKAAYLDQLVDWLFAQTGCSVRMHGHFVEAVARPTRPFYGTVWRLCTRPYPPVGGSTFELNVSAL